MEQLWHLILGNDLKFLQLTEFRIYNTASVFVFLFSAVLLKEEITGLKVVSVLLSMAGVIIITLTSTQQHSTGTESNTVSSLNIM